MRTAMYTHFCIIKLLLQVAYDITRRIPRKYRENTRTVLVNVHASGGAGEDGGAICEAHVNR